jgi:predicted nicotinamide N-methyase
MGDTPGLDMTFDRAAFIKTNTHLAPVPLRPDIKLHLAEEATGLWQKTQDELHAINLPLPYWAFAWPGGQALARYILEHQTFVAGKRVLDLGAGSGLVAIAAAKAGAAHVDANDIDPLAVDAISMNAVANHVDINIISDDIVGSDQTWDVVLAGDMSYEQEMAERVTLWLEQQANKGTRVLIGDPGRTYLARDRLHSLAHYEVPVSKALEDCEMKLTHVWRFKDAM